MMGLYSWLINYFGKRRKTDIDNYANKSNLIKKIEDKSELIKRIDEDLLSHGWKKRECETHVTYTKEFKIKKEGQTN